MIRTDPYTYSRSCADCAQGRWWISPDTEEIRLCAEHETIVHGQPGWEAAALAGEWLRNPDRFRVKTVAGYHIEVIPMMLNFRVHTVPVDGGPLAWSERYWCYPGRSETAFVAAVLAAHAWDGAPDTEPVGWIKSWDQRVREAG